MCTELERQGIEYEGNILRFSLHSPEKSKKIEKYHILFFYFFIYSQMATTQSIAKVRFSIQS